METGVRKYQEPALQDLLADPVILAVLKRDGLTVNDVIEVVKTYQEKTRLRPS
ncbi:hypothetical protein [Sneathiella sp. HT1-7]|jgi:hypothetical protein|uniref:hypothetical protein n=1 Tax=Sneathiella sp. HT1-7 TaxID=2887192 RepID=UPI001D13901E|nr:hypothetical protein [Sneathiella sp. HT1-7]MCC3306512.1 hypothetical protein [Sneathiella sp. HT1-7]